MAEPTPPTAPLDITLLEQLPDAPPDGAPASEDREARLDRVSGLVTRGAYTEAAQLAEALLREGLRDVRLAGPYLLGAFLERGLEALPVIFSSLGKLLTVHWESFGPPEKRTVHAQSGLRWLLKVLNKHFEHHARSKDETWRRWCEPHNREPVQQALALADEVLGPLETTLPGSGCEIPFQHLTTALSSHLAALPAAPPPAAQAPEPEEGEEPEAEDERDSPEERPRRAQARGPLSQAPQGAGPSFTVSPALALLMRKLEAFDALLERGDLARASVVAADVLHTIDHFDPRVYLPTLFTRFFSGLSTHADSVERLLQSTDSLAFRALEQLYRVDLNAFLAQDAGLPEE